MKKKDWEGGVQALSAKAYERDRSKSEQLLRIGLMSGAMAFNEALGRGLTKGHVLAGLEASIKRQDLTLERLRDISFGLGRALTTARKGASAPSEDFSFFSMIKKADGADRQSEREFEATLAFIGGICAAMGQLAEGAFEGKWLQRLILEADASRLERALNCGLSVWAPTPSKFHPLEIAYEARSVECAELLLMRGAHPRGRNWKAPIPKRPETPPPMRGVPLSAWPAQLTNAFAEFSRYMHDSPKLGRDRWAITQAVFISPPTEWTPARLRPSSAQMRWSEEEAKKFAEPLARLNVAFEEKEAAWSALADHSEGKMLRWVEKGILSAAAGEASKESPRLRL